MDLYLPSRAEFLTVWEAETLDTAGRQALDAGERDDRVVAVKDGARGAVAFTHDARVQVPANEVEPQNTVGAGDSFNARFVLARGLNLDLEDSLKFGCATAAVKIPTPELPTLYASGWRPRPAPGPGRNELADIIRAALHTSPAPALV
ncbi:MAG: carbohydrate kinase family protein [Streptosporangiaceae bacterium]